MPFVVFNGKQKVKEMTTPLLETTALVLVAAHATVHFPHELKTIWSYLDAWIDRQPWVKACHWRRHALLAVLLALTASVAVGPTFYYGLETMLRLAATAP